MDAKIKVKLVEVRGRWIDDVSLAEPLVAWAGRPCHIGKHRIFQEPLNFDFVDFGFEIRDRKA